MRITALTENTSKNGLLSEHGLSLYIETENRKILFDTGQSDLFSKNAETLGIDLSEVDLAVLSHGHYDHGGGLKKFLELNNTAKVYMNKHAFEPHYNGTEKYIGLDVCLMDNERIVFTDEVFNIEKGLTLYSCNGKDKLLDSGSFGLNTEENGKLVPDDFRHEHYLLIEENAKRVLISGCSHKGIINIESWFKPDCLVGGFHFSKIEDDNRLKALAQALNAYDTVFYTCHCTGLRQYGVMKKYMDSLNYISAGDTVVV